MTDEILYPLKEGTPEERLQPLMEKYWSELGRWRFEIFFNHKWLYGNPPSALLNVREFSPDFGPVARLVRIPRKIKVEIPEPVREPLESGELYWTIEEDAVGRMAPDQYCWVGMGNIANSGRLRDGLIWRTREEARQFLDAIKEAK